MTRWIYGLAAALLLIPATLTLAQAPPPVPALPDTARTTSYSISGTTCACSVGFALYQDGTDIDNWIQVYLNGTAVLSTDPTFGWSLSSATGALSTIARPITNAVLTFNANQTGTVTIVGAARPRRLSQFAENRGVAARDLNQALTSIIAEQREAWDKINGLSPSIARVSADVAVTSSTTLANVAGLSFAVASGNTYSFDVYLTCTDAAAGGVKAAIAGTATATSIVYDGYVIESNAIKGQANATALGTAVASSTTTATSGIVIRIQGTITVNAGGTLTVQFAQNTSNGTASTVKRGSYMRLQ